MSQDALGNTPVGASGPGVALGWAGELLSAAILRNLEASGGTSIFRPGFDPSTGALDSDGLDSLPVWNLGGDGMSIYGDPGIGGAGSGTGGGGVSGGGGSIGVNINLGGGGGKKKNKGKARGKAAKPLQAVAATDVWLEGYRQRFESALGTDEQLNAAEGSGPLASPLAKTTGRLVRDAGELLDDNSAATARFKDALTSGALSEIESARIGEERALGSAERTGSRDRRDLALRFGGASNPTAMAAIGARSAERFGGARAGVEERAGSARAQVLGKAAQFFEGFRRDFARDAVTTAQNFVANSAFIRDSFRTLQASMAANIGNLRIGQQANAIQQRGQTLDAIAGVAGAALGALGAYAANRAGNSGGGGGGGVSVTLGGSGSTSPAY